MDDLKHTQPIERVTTAPRRAPGATRKALERARGQTGQPVLSPAARRMRITGVLLLPAVLATAIAWIVLSGGENATVPDSSRVFSLSGHLPNEPVSDRRITMSWAPVAGAAGYWWGMVTNPAEPPKPWIRPSADDAKVTFEFGGRGYFVLRTAKELDGRLQWSSGNVYGPIIVRAGAPQADAVGRESEGLSEGSSLSGDGVTGPGGSTGSSGSGGSSSDRPTNPGNPGGPGTPGTGDAEAGTAGEPGEPAEEPPQPARNCNQSGGCDGQQGRDGPPGESGNP